MVNRQKIIEEIMVSFHTLRSKLHPKGVTLEKGMGMTYSQLMVLAIIQKKQFIGVKKIAQYLDISSSATTQLVDGLVVHGLVVRKTDTTDRRALHLSISTKGKTHLTKFTTQRLNIMQNLFSVLTDQELVTYLKLHKKITTK